MTRFVFLSFLFMGWAFYELSGGADFEPRGVRPPKPERHATTDRSFSNRKPFVKPTSGLRPIEVTSLVAKPAIARRKPIQPVQAVAEPEIVTAAESAARLDQVRTSLSQGLTMFSESDPARQPLTLVSLEQGVAGIQVVAPADDQTDLDTGVDQVTDPVAIWTVPAADIREVTGTRVNMRDGPGTIYPILARLTIGQEVEVLGDSGTGWLRLRMMPGRQIGWVSASLVSKAAR